MNSCVLHASWRHQTILRYAVAFDSDRTSLAHAYADDALFSCSVHNPYPSDVNTDHDAELIESFIPREIIRKASELIILQTVS